MSGVTLLQLGIVVGCYLFGVIPKEVLCSLFQVKGSLRCVWSGVFPRLNVVW